MLKIGDKDVFEKEYMQAFRSFAGQFGEFVVYERDRGAIDIGLQLTRKLPDGSQRVTQAFCWFQMKGLMASTLTEEEFTASKEIKLSLDVLHLRYWLVLSFPVYLVVYVQSVKTFLILNIQSYIADKWGRGILTLDQKTATVEVPTTSLLDAHAFGQILDRSDEATWAKVLDADHSEVRICRRDYELIWHFGTAKERGVEHRVDFWDWQSKLRGQLYIQEGKADGAWVTLREHWQPHLRIEMLESTYPYLELYSLEEDDDYNPWNDEDENAEVPKLELANGDTVGGINCSYEYFEYFVGARLNELGQQLYKHVCLLRDIDLITIEEGAQHWVSIAPWNRKPRSV